MDVACVSSKMYKLAEFEKSFQLIKPGSLPISRFSDWQIAATLYESRLVSLNTRIIIDEEFSSLVWSLPSHSVTGIYIVGSGKGKLSYLLDVFRASPGFHTLQVSDNFQAIINEFPNNSQNLVVVTKRRDIIDRLPLGTTYIYVSDAGIECAGCQPRLQDTSAEFVVGDGKVMAGWLLPKDCWLKPWPLPILRSVVPSLFMHVCEQSWSVSTPMETARVIGVSFDTHVNYCMDYLSLMFGLFSDFGEQPVPDWSQYQLIKPVFPYPKDKLLGLHVDSSFWRALLGHGKKWSRVCEARIHMADATIKANIIYKFLLFAFNCVSPKLGLDRKLPKGNRAALHIGEALVLCASLMYQGDLEEVSIISKDLSVKSSGSRFAGIGKASAEYLGMIPDGLGGKSVKVDIKGRFWQIDTQLGEDEFECGPYYEVNTEYPAVKRNGWMYVRVSNLSVREPSSNLRSPWEQSVSRGAGNGQQQQRKQKQKQTEKASHAPNTAGSVMATAAVGSNGQSSKPKNGMLTVFDMIKM